MSCAPLAITQTLIDLIRKDPDHDTAELVESLRVANTRAIGLTEALLMLSRAGQRSFTAEHVDLSLVAEKATETLLVFAEQHDVTLHTSGEVAPVIGSSALLLQMTSNLVHNAIVHNLAKQGRVSIITRLDVVDAVLTVENTGEKLSLELVPTLAEPFQRGDERIRTRDAGVGVGLAVVRSVVLAHDGTLTLTPRPDGGLCVMVRLPAATSR